MTREDWLQRAVGALRPRFTAAGHELPPRIHVSVGLPSKRALSAKARRIGECWPGAVSKDGNAHIFITPLIEAPFQVLDVLTHELVHVATPGAGHKRAFVKVAQAVGLTQGPATSQRAGSELEDVLIRLNTELGVYPHAALDPKQLNAKKQGTRLLKVGCEACGYTVRITRQWLDMGAPICPVDEVAMVEL